MCPPPPHPDPAPRPTPYAYRHPHPAVAVDLGIFTIRDRALHVLLVERGVEPFRGQWALPGGFVRIDEDLSAAAIRELREETGVTPAYLEQVGAFGDPGRDPRERVISIAYAAILPSHALQLSAATDAAAVRWWTWSDLPTLAFDHADIVRRAHDHIVLSLRCSPIAFQFLPEEFTLTDLQQVHEAIRGNTLDKRNFRKAILAQQVLVPTGRTRRDGGHRPAELFRLSPSCTEMLGALEASVERSNQPPAATSSAAYAQGYADGVRAASRRVTEATRLLLESPSLPVPREG